MAVATAAQCLFGDTESTSANCATAWCDKVYKSAEKTNHLLILQLRQYTYE